MTASGIFWYYPPMNRHGLMLRDMNEEQRRLAYALMATGLTEDSNRQAQLIIEHEDVLGPLEKEAGHVTFLRDTLWYAWTIFGDPASDAEPWGWRVEGHHVSLHYSVWGDRVLSPLRRSSSAQIPPRYARARSRACAS